MGWLHIPSDIMSEGGFLASIGVIGLAAIAIAIAVILLVILVALCRHPRV